MLLAGNVPSCKLPYLATRVLSRLHDGSLTPSSRPEHTIIQANSHASPQHESLCEHRCCHLHLEGATVDSSTVHHTSLRSVAQESRTVVLEDKLPMSMLLIFYKQLRQSNLHRVRPPEGVMRSIVVMDRVCTQLTKGAGWTGTSRFGRAEPNRTC